MAAVVELLDALGGAVGAHRGKALLFAVGQRLLAVPALEADEGERLFFHGAKTGNWFSHLAVECPGEECSTEWLEPVGDGDYAKMKENDR